MVAERFLHWHSNWLYIICCMCTYTLTRIVYWASLSQDYGIAIVGAVTATVDDIAVAVIVVAVLLFFDFLAVSSNRWILLLLLLLLQLLLLLLFYIHFSFSVAFRFCSRILQSFVCHTPVSAILLTIHAQHDIKLDTLICKTRKIN